MKNEKVVHADLGLRGHLKIALALSWDYLCQVQERRSGFPVASDIG